MHHALSANQAAASIIAAIVAAITEFVKEVNVPGVPETGHVRSIGALAVLHKTLSQDSSMSCRVFSRVVGRSS